MADNLYLCVIEDVAHRLEYFSGELIECSRTEWPFEMAMRIGELRKHLDQIRLEITAGLDEYVDGLRRSR